MRYLLDTNIWIYYLKNADSLVTHRLKTTPAREVAVCSVVWAELLYGAGKYQRQVDRIARVEQALAPFDSLSFDSGSDRHYATIRNDLEKRGETIGPNDLLIGAIALQHSLTLVSNDRGFRRIDGLMVEDW